MSFPRCWRVWKADGIVFGEKQGAHEVVEDLELFLKGAVSFDPGDTPKHALFLVQRGG